MIIIRKIIDYIDSIPNKLSFVLQCIFIGLVVLFLYDIYKTSLEFFFVWVGIIGLLIYIYDKSKDGD